MATSNRVQHLRDAAQLTRDELAEVIGEPVAELERYEAGEPVPAHVAQKLAQTFGVSLPFLRGEE